MIVLLKRSFFHGFYFKHQKNNKVACFIPGISKSNSFIQVITDTCSLQYSFDNAEIRKQAINIGLCSFSDMGIEIDLPDIKGLIEYTNLTPLKTDIMSFFKYFPMECRHGVVSMKHNLKGILSVEDEIYDFNEGTGYIELDKGKSFPKRYVWVQSNEMDNFSIMMSVADIPFCKFYFEGCICAIIYNMQEYRLATYLGAKAQVFSDKVIITQRNMKIEAIIIEAGKHFDLLYPIRGKMSGIVKEHNNSKINFKFYIDSNLVVDAVCENCGFEIHNY
jgi:tocopherol cyclase